MIPLALYVFNEDLQFGLTSYYTNYPEAVETWEEYHASFGEKNFPIEFNMYLYDVKNFFEPYAERNNLDKNAVNFWIFATGEHIQNAIKRLNIDTSKIPKWNKYIEVMKNHVEGAVSTHNTRTSANILEVLNKTIKKTTSDIKKAVDPNESILPFVIAGVVLLALTR